MKKNNPRLFVMVIALMSFSILFGCQQRVVKVTAPEEQTALAEEVLVFDKIILHLNFDADKAAIKEVDYEKLLRVIGVLETYPKANIVVEGHTDNVGPKDYNHELSHKRADAVKNFIVIHSSIEASRIKTVGYGESRPMATNEDEAGRVHNRRVEILVASE